MSHRKLLAKLQHYGVRGTLLTWITEFLTGRSQRVVDSIARSRHVYSGVPQATCLGPILFLFISMTSLLTSHLRCDYLPTMLWSLDPFTQQRIISSSKMTDSLLKDGLWCGICSSILPNVTFCQRQEMGTSLYTSTHYVGKYYNR